MNPASYIFQEINTIKKNSSISGWKVGAACFWTLFFLICVNSVLALDWSDRKWVEAGCPPSVFGTWISDKTNNKNEKVLNIAMNRIKVTGNRNIEEEFSFNKRNIVSGKRFVEIKLQPISKDVKMSTYLKIRPHLINLENDSKNMNPDTYHCLIKVFQFDSINKAKFDKYSSWEIYKLKK